MLSALPKATGSNTLFNLGPSGMLSTVVEEGRKRKRGGLLSKMGIAPALTSLTHASHTPSHLGMDYAVLATAGRL